MRHSGKGSAGRAGSTKGEADGVEAATAFLDEFIEALGADLGERVNAGYPHLVLGR